MANPVIIACPVGVWTLVALNKTTGVINILDQGPQYLQTYRDTGQAAPATIAEGVRFSDPLQISKAVASDIYIWCQGGAGSIRADL